jgi:hypothetical protein
MNQQRVNIFNRSCSISQHRSDQRISFIVLFPITILLIKNMFVTTLQFASNYNYYLNIIIFISMAIIYVHHVFKFGLTINKLSLLVLLLSSLFWFLSFFLRPDIFRYSYLRSAVETFIVYCIPPLIFLPLIYNTDIFLDFLIRYNRIVAVMAVLCLFLVLAGFPTVGGYSMSFGKAAVVPAVVLAFEYSRNRKIIDLLLFLFCVLSILILGSRWPLLNIAAIIVYGLIKFLKIKNLWKVVLNIIILIIIVIILYFSKQIIDVMHQGLINLGVNSRTLNMLVSDSITYSSGRSEIHNELILKLRESPVLGYGAGGGYLALNNGLPHHFVLDTVANFGYPLGMLIIICSALLTILQFWRNRSNSYGQIIIIYACLFWPKITVGESFWSSDKYWMLISLFIVDFSRRSIQQYVR